MTEPIVAPIVLDTAKECGCNESCTCGTDCACCHEGDCAAHQPDDCSPA